MILDEVIVDLPGVLWVPLVDKVPQERAFLAPLSQDHMLLDTDARVACDLGSESLSGGCVVGSHP